MKKLLALLLTFTMLMSGAVVFADTTVSKDTLFTPVSEIEMWEFNSEAEGQFPTKAFLALPTFDTVDNLGVAKFDPTTAGMNVGFAQQDLSGVDGYLAIEAKVKAPAVLGYNLQMLGATMQTHGNNLSVPGFSNITGLTINDWIEFTYIVDMSEKTVNGSNLDNIKPYLLVLNGNKYQPANTSTLTVAANSARNYLDYNKGTNGVLYMDYFRVYTVNETEIAEFIKPEEAIVDTEVATQYTVDTYLNKLEFNTADELDVDGKKFDTYWSAPTVENVDGKNVAVFDTNTVGGNIGLVNERLTSLINAGKKYAVMETRLKAKNLTGSFLMFGGYIVSYSNTEINVYANPNFKVAVTGTDWNEFAVVMDISSATANADGSVSGVKPAYITVNGAKYKINNGTVNLGATQTNFLQKNQGIIYMDYYKLYAPDEADFAAKHPAPAATKYEVDEMIKEYDFTYTGDYPAHAFNQMPELGMVDGKQVAVFNSNNSKYDNNGTAAYINIGYSDSLVLGSLDGDYIVAEASVKYGAVDFYTMMLFEGIMRFYNISGSADKFNASAGGYIVRVNRDEWVDIAVVLDKSQVTYNSETSKYEGSVKTVKAIINGVEYDMSHKSLTFDPNTDYNWSYMQSSQDNVEFYVDYMKLYSTSDYSNDTETAFELVDTRYMSDFDKTAYTSYLGDNGNNVVTLADGTTAMKIIAQSYPQKNGDIRHDNFTTDTVVYETRVMIPKDTSARTQRWLFGANVLLKPGETEDVMNVVVGSSNGSVTVKTDLSYDEWHKITLTMDADNSKYISLFIDDVEYDITAAGFRAWVASGVGYVVEGTGAVGEGTACENVMYLDYLYVYKTNDLLSDIMFTDASGAEIKELPSDTLNVAMGINPLTADITMLVALYDGGKLTNLKKASLTQDKLSAALEIPEGTSANASVKVMIWNKNLAPYKTETVFPAISE